MKKALISPNEVSYNYEGIILGTRVAQVSDYSFEVAPPLFWIDCDDDIDADKYYYDMQSQTIIAKPIQPAPLEENVTVELLNFEDLF